MKSTGNAPLRPTAVVLDVDGVIAPIGGSTVWGDDITVGDPETGLHLSAAMCAAIEQIHSSAQVGCYWLTDWDQAMRHEQATLPGRSWPAIADPATGPAQARDWAGDRWNVVSWWKWWALDEWLHRHREVRRVVWIDDHLRTHQLPADPNHIRAATTWTSTGRLGAGTKALLVAPDKRTGLTPQDLRTITDWICGRRPGTEHLDEGTA